METNISKFCDERGINAIMRDTFIAYARSLNSSKFELKKDGDTVKLTVDKMTMEEVKEVWNQFVLDLSQVLPHEKVSKRKSVPNKSSIPSA